MKEKEILELTQEILDIQKRYFREFVYLVEEMREAQERYVTEKDIQSVLYELEDLVDSAITIFKKI